MLTHGELFAGISGFGLGFERAGMVTKWCVEKDKNCQSVLRRHHPQVPIYDDVTTSGRDNLSPVDVISFGSPCQDMSVAGKRAGINGEQSGLFFEAIRIIRELRPTYAVWENVPGALSSNGGRDFGAALDALAQSGALDIGWTILDAQWFGVAQRRRRLFVVTDFGGRRAQEILSIPFGRQGDTPPSREKGQRVAGPITASTPSRRNGGSSPVSDSFVAGSLTSGLGGPDDNDAQAHHIVSTLNSSGAGTARPGGQAAEPDFYVVTPSSIDDVARGQTSRQNRLAGDADNFVAFQQNTRDEVRLMNGDGQIAGALAAQPGMKQQNYITVPEPITFESRYARNGRGAPDTVVPPLKAQSGESGKGDGAPMVFNWQSGIGLSASEESSGTLLKSQSPADSGTSGVRRLMPVECERLQGFPDNWTDGQSDSTRYKQLGNAVAVPVAQWIGRRIVKVHESGQA